VATVATVSVPSRTIDTPNHARPRARPAQLMSEVVVQSAAAASGTLLGVFLWMTKKRPTRQARFRSESADTPRALAVVADDDDDTRALLVAALRRDGFETSEARNGNELVERVEVLHRKGRDAQIVVSDIGMPECDGVQAARRLRRISLRLPILLVTGSAGPETRRAGLAAGVCAILQKPISAFALMQAVKLAMGV
jgi:CheY-like chemotaxis protein